MQETRNKRQETRDKNKKKRKKKRKKEKKKKEKRKKKKRKMLLSRWGMRGISSSKKIAHEQKKLDNKIERMGASKLTAPRHLLLFFYDRNIRHFGPSNVATLLFWVSRTALRFRLENSTKNERFFDHASRKAFDMLPKMSISSLARVALAFSVVKAAEEDVMARMWPLINDQAEQAQPADVVFLLEAFKRFDEMRNRRLPSLPSEPEPSRELVATLEKEKDQQEKLSVPTEPILNLLQKPAVEHINLFEPRQIELLAQGYASHTYSNWQPVFNAIEGRVEADLFPFSPSRLDSLAWAFIKAGHHESPLLQKIQDHAKMLRIQLDTFRPRSS